MMLKVNIHEESRINYIIQCESILVFGPENSKIELNALFHDVNIFRKALRHFAIRNEFGVRTVKSNKKRFIEKSKRLSCF
jgi:MuDR family transposase